MSTSYVFKCKYRVHYFFFLLVSEKQPCEQKAWAKKKKNLKCYVEFHVTVYRKHLKIRSHTVPLQQLNACILMRTDCNIINIVVKAGLKYLCFIA